MKEKGDECIFVGYSTQSRVYRVFNKRTRVIMESIHVNFDESPQMASAHNSSDPAPTCQTMASVQISYDPAPKCQTMTLEQVSLSPGRKCQENVSQGDKTGTTSNELDLLFSPMFDELLNGSSKVVSKSSAVSAADAPNQRQQLSTPLNNHTTPAPTCQTPSIAPTLISPENINQTMALEHGSLSPGRTGQENVSHRNTTDTTSNELDLVFSSMLDELLNGSSKVVSKSSAVSAADAPNQRQQPTTPLNTHTTPVPTYEGSKILYSIEGTLLKEEIFSEFDEFMAMTADENSKSKSDTEEPPFKKITINTDYKIKTSLKEPPTYLELKSLPDNLEYVFLEEPSFIPVIISSKLSTKNKSKLVSILKKHKEAFAWKMTDIPGICLSFFVINENDELVPTKTVTGWRVCIEYCKLNEEIAKDHFPLPFMDEMLERLT
nr:reverse transcriptase domain-containing protein [Tanacetum cinerariifolium]